jgi:MerR family copper efflux transcriptional regulator
MNIGEVANSTGITTKMIRYYESIGLIKETQRTDAGYRTYGDNEVNTLHFIKRARKLGFSLEQIRDLLSLWQNPGRASADVKAIAMEHVAELNQRIVELTEMRDTLHHLARACGGNNMPECPILSSLATIEHDHTDHCSHQRVAKKRPAKSA